MASSSSMALMAFVVLALMASGAWCASISFAVKSYEADKFELAVKNSAKEISEVDIKEKGSNDFQPMKKFGDVWCIKTSQKLKGPISVRLTCAGGGKRVQDDVIPEAAKAGSSYESTLSF
ncbi:hypothetical protein ACP70R_001213 [Stipagrostis hirtigluma subsp. patula]